MLFGIMCILLTSRFFVSCIALTESVTIVFGE